VGERGVHSFYSFFPIHATVNGTVSPDYSYLKVM
jgi:hypothetical protein